MTACRPPTFSTARGAPPPLARAAGLEDSLLARAAGAAPYLQRARQLFQHARHRLVDHPLHTIAIPDDAVHVVLRPAAPHQTIGSCVDDVEHERAGFVVDDVNIAGVAGAVAVSIVNAVDIEAATFWRRRGFIPSKDDPLILFRSIADVAASLNEAVQGNAK